MCVVTGTGPIVDCVGFVVCGESSVRTRAFAKTSVFLKNLTFMWPCIVKLGTVMVQLDATHMQFIQRHLCQHVSGINMPIVRRTMWWTTAYDVQHWYCWQWSDRAGPPVVCTLWNLLTTCTRCTQHPTIFSQIFPIHSHFFGYTPPFLGPYRPLPITNTLLTISHTSHNFFESFPIHLHFSAIHPPFFGPYRPLPITNTLPTIFHTSHNFLHNFDPLSCFLLQDGH
jgi:hypothetical protein